MAELDDLHADTPILEDGLMVAMDTEADVLMDLVLVIEGEFRDVDVGDSSLKLDVLLDHYAAILKVSHPITMHHDRYASRLIGTC